MLDINGANWKKTMKEKLTRYLVIKKKGVALVLQQSIGN
jgi:hypothetical protein